MVPNKACNTYANGVECTNTPGSLPRCRTDYRCIWSEALNYCTFDPLNYEYQYSFETCSPNCTGV